MTGTLRHQCHSFLSVTFHLRSGLGKMVKKKTKKVLKRSNSSVSMMIRENGKGAAEEEEIQETHYSEDEFEDYFDDRQDEFEIINENEEKEESKIENELKSWETQNILPNYPQTSK